MKSIKQNRDQVKYTDEAQRYWAYEHTHGRYSPEGILEESPRANPDGFDSAMSLYDIKEADKEVQARVSKLLDIAKQILTEQQYKVFVLVAVKDPAMTEREAAETLGLSRGRVHQLWTIAREKLQKAYEART